MAPDTEEVQPIELLQTDTHYIFQRGNSSLWCDRLTGNFEPKTGWDLLQASDPECLGVVYGLIGKFQVHSELDQRLLLIRHCDKACDLPGGYPVYKITSVAILPLGHSSNEHGPTEYTFEPCRKHHADRKRSSISGSNQLNSSISIGMGSTGLDILLQQKAVAAKTWGTIKSATNSLKTTTAHAAAQVIPGGRKKEGKLEKERLEKRILDELFRMFSELQSYYFSYATDLTNSLQRQQRDSEKEDDLSPLWKRADDRFFWNKQMLSDLINAEEPRFDEWIVPIMHGFVQVEKCTVDLDGIGIVPVPTPNGIKPEEQQPSVEEISLALISRRSRYRAGTRYKRRGVDETGKVANYVETEQLLSFHQHHLSFVQVRGSLPVFWSQPGYKYRPPPRLDKGEEECHAAFDRHFAEETSLYDTVAIISLVEQAGKEKVLADAYLRHILRLDSPSLTYISFDFHEYCKGMHFENVCILIQNIEDVVRDMRYCWKDREGLICEQKGVFRVNCVDCLDRTNVVQTFIGRWVIESQFTKLGLAAPESPLPKNIRNTLQQLWANNGDVISKQYAGTSALKGDYTRTGERKFTGLMKDGMNSANRYYLNRFKDAYRQATIDIMLGNPVSDDLLSPDDRNSPSAPGTDELDHSMTAEHVKHLMEDCKKLLIDDQDSIVGAWGLIDADPETGDPTETELDSILILTRHSYFVAEYDADFDRVTKYQRVLLHDMDFIELGPEKHQSAASTVKNFFHRSGNNANLGSTSGSDSSDAADNSPLYLRLNYCMDNQPGYFHMFRSTNLRFFNNVAVVIRSEEEMGESLKAICEAFVVALEVEGINIKVVKNKLEKRRSRKPSSCTVGGRTGESMFLDLPQRMTRNVSETQLMAIKSAGTKALSNMTSQFAKFNLLRKKENQETVIVPTRPVFTMETPLPSPSVPTSSPPEDDECLQAPLDLVLPSCGIVSSTAGTADDVDEMYPSNAVRLPMGQTVCQLPSPSTPRCPTPEITVTSTGNTLGTQIACRHLSKSSEWNSSDSIGLSEDANKEPGVSLKSSQSESALKISAENPGPVPAASGFFNPLSKLAKGVQNLGAGALASISTIPSNMSPGTRVHQPKPRSEQMQAEIKRCQTRIIDV